MKATYLLNYLLREASSLRVEVFQVGTVRSVSCLVQKSAGSTVAEKVRALEACGTGLLGHKDRLTGPQVQQPPPPPTFYLQPSFRGTCVVARSTARMNSRGGRVGDKFRTVLSHSISARPDQSNDESDKWRPIKLGAGGSQDEGRWP